MLPLALIHQWAAVVAPHVVTAGILLGAALLALAIGLFRAPRELPKALPGLLFFAGGGALYFTPLWKGGSHPPYEGTLLVVAVALIAHFVACWRVPDDGLAEPGAPSGRPALVYIALALVVAAALLFENLGGYSGTLVSWEAPVVRDGFAYAWNRNTSVIDFARERLLWDDGVLSAGHTSLFYGAPTYALFTLAGFSTWALRCASVVATLFSVVVIFAIGRRFFGPLVSVAVAVLFASNTAVLFYGRYGSSIAGTILAVLLAVYCTWLFLERERSAWWLGAVAAAALYVATLQYSPGRIAVLVLLGFIPIALVLKRERPSWRRVVGLLLLLSAVAGVWHFQGQYHHRHYFLRARGEQYFTMLRNPYSIKSLVGEDLAKCLPPPQRMQWDDKATVLLHLLDKTVPQYLKLLSPKVRHQQRGVVVGFDPPPLPMYYAPLVLFILMGVGHSLVRWRSWPHLFLLLFALVYSVPLLLTNRVDAHRSILFVIPFSLWAAFGCLEAARLMRRVRVPVLLQHCLAAALAASVVYADVVMRTNPGARLPAASQILADEMYEVSGPVVYGLLRDHRERGWLQLEMLKRESANPQDTGRLMATAVVDGLRGDRGGPTAFAISQVERMARGGTVILAPARQFRAAVARLQERGLRAAERGSGTVRFLRVDGGAAATGVSDGKLKPMPTIVTPPTPTPFPLAEGPQTSLTDLEPIKVEFGFQPPKVGKTWNGQSVRMGGVLYEKALGTHAWTRMTYAVPTNAVALQAVIGLSDSIGQCERAAVTFEVKDREDRLLYESGVIDIATPPRPIRVELEDARAITLVTTEAGNGRDCDHANWGRPSFLLAPGRVRAKP